MNLDAQNFDFHNFLHLLMAEIIKITKFRAPRMAKKAVLKLLDYPKLYFTSNKSAFCYIFSGWLRDTHGDFQLGFYFAGAMIFVSGVMLFVLPKLQRDRELEDEEAVHDDDDERFPEIVEEEGYDSDDHQMTMEAKEPVKA